MVDRIALTPQEVADILKIAKNTVYELIKRGELNSYRVGNKVRVDLQDVEDYINKSKKLNNVEAPNTNSAKSNPLSYNDFPTDKGFVICGQDVVLDILSRYLEQHPNGVRALRSYIGSYNGLYSLYQGDAHIATTHLWDSDSNIYNIPFVRRMLPGIPAYIIHIACRMQGFYVAKGNPKKIRGWEDLKRSDIIIINREKGSGTRVLLDEHLRLLDISGSNIKGYTRECTSHLAVASTVARGGADIALGNEKTCLQVQGIDFIPLQKERYELVIKKDDYNKPQFNAIANILRSKEFKMEISGLGGYDITEMGKIIAET